MSTIIIGIIEFIKIKLFKTPCGHGVDKSTENDSVWLNLAKNIQGVKWLKLMYLDSTPG